MNSFLAAALPPLFAAVRNRACRFLPPALRLLPLAIFWTCASTLPAQDLAVKFYAAQNGLGGSLRNALVQAPDGNFYGAAGAIIRLDPEGEAKAVYFFSDLADNGTNVEGSQPVGGLVLGQDGNLYGLTDAGGAYGLGTVYQFNPATDAVQPVASLTAAVQNFGSSVVYPGALVQDRAGNFYYLSQTVTSTVTTSTETFAVMQVTPAGTINPFHVFTTPAADGTNPEGFDPCSGLVIDGRDYLYGFTDSGGSGGLGTFYEVDPGGGATALYSYYPDPNVVDTTPQVPFDRANSIVATGDGTVYGAAQGYGGTSGGAGVATIAGGSILKAAGDQPVAFYTFSDGVFQDDGTYRNSDGVFPWRPDPRTRWQALRRDRRRRCQRHGHDLPDHARG